MRCVHVPYIAALHVLIALTVPGCVHVCLHFADGVGLAGVCMFHVFIVMFILVLNYEVLWASLDGLGTVYMLCLIIISMGGVLSDRSQLLTSWIFLQNCLHLLLDHLPLDLNFQDNKDHSVLSTASPACKAVLHQMGKSHMVCCHLLATTTFIEHNK